ncbi:unnamed protein product [Rhizoctonia solani]|uniref:Velvet domain-containing protein n=3 Tax=Rhizoctonia solani TaxID=456999 RepID=A0A8H3CWF3_9AGAM|nr:velvet factor [Rhizoctonia solani AG-3 Rhs1AP]KEP52516.1 velvet factor [Rhizoctonia solani 123E]CAE6484241.1 unnamed protein product [Rhizoctonia solani]CAE6496490.1 unnamed protein product [Rhizoctonia solani]
MCNNFTTYPKTQEMYIGKPIRNVVGPFAGRTIRSELEEYQKPDLGRKFAKRDRRPVDPPPVVRLRMFDVKDEGTLNQREEEIPAESIETTGLIAHVDLFAVNPPVGMTFEDTEDYLEPTIDTGEPQASNHASSSQQGRRISDNSVDVSEDAVLTSAVFGSSFVHAVKINDTEGKMVILFVFADLSVKIEGHFVYRYRCFNLFSRVAGSDDVPITAELFSGIFVIYSTKEFPGLQASTTLTKHLGRWGVRVNLRETSRGKRNRRGDEYGEEDDGSSGGGDVIVDEEQGVHFYSRSYLAQQTPQIMFRPPDSHQEEGSYGNAP